MSRIVTLCYLECSIYNNKKNKTCRETKKYDQYTGKEKSHQGLL